MKKILWVINPLQFKEDDLAYPQYISRVINGKLTGVFLENGRDTNPSATYNVFNYSKVFRKEITPNEEQEKVEKRKMAVIKVLQEKALCVNLHQDGGIPLQDLIMESRYADILLVDAGLTFDETDNHLPSSFVKNVLSKAECPVLVMPAEHKEIREIVFTYNGSYSSVFAIKQFTYLFSGLQDLQATVLYAPEDDAGDSLERKRFIAELLRSHYSRLDFKVMHDKLDHCLFPEILLKTDAIIVFGGYRNKPSSRSVKGNAENAIHSIRLPIFITQTFELTQTPPQKSGASQL